MAQGMRWEIVQECKHKLLMMKHDLLNRVKASRLEFTAQDKAMGDEADQTMAQIAEDNYLISQSRLRAMLMEIEYALMRIENGSFGICEETQEPIEFERLLAIPYTRLSIEGAEIRESLERKFAR